MSPRKLIMAEAARAILGKDNALSISGSEQQIQIFTEAVIASKKYHAALNCPSPILEDVKNALIEKKRAALKFKQIMGFDWNL